jgi:large subunit ribosomal protein L25
MEAITISASPRSGTGKGANRKLRASGQIPAVLYGHNVEDAISLSIDPRALNKALDNPKGQNALLEIDIEGGGTHTALVRELQRQPVSRKVLHVDLVCPNLEQEQVCLIPVKFVGKCIGVALGGRLRTPCRDLTISCLPANIPTAVEIDVTELQVDDSVMVSEVAFTDGVSAIYDRDFVIVKVVRARGEAAADEEGGEEAGESDGGAADGEG